MDKKANGEINWAETILLPNTEFPMRANLPDAEPSLLKDWNDIDIYAKNREISKVAKSFYVKARETKIKQIIKPALESLKELKKSKKYFDLVFIDADKENYINYYNSAKEMIKKGDLIIIDNVLWHGEVADYNNKDKFTNLIREFNKHVKNDKNTEQIILPIGDGFTICRKI